MNCPHCTTANPAQARFCLACGRPLVSGLVCSTCHTLLPPHARYCFHCGALVLQPVRRCPQCGSNVEPGHTHCAACGAQIFQPAGPLSPAASPSVAPAAPSGTVPVEATDLALNQLPSPRPMQELLASLQRYLPYDLYEPLERRPTASDLIRTRDHLSALLQTTKTYLPRPVALSPQPAGEPAGCLCQGTFLFVDVSGFTPLSERLGRLGHEGAERITDIINDLFFDLVSILFDHGGMLLKFGGDALLGLFPGESEAEMAAGALRATQAAAAMQAQMEKFAAIEAGGDTHALRIKCGLASGPYFSAHIGTLHSMGYVTMGHTVNRADQAEGHAAPGEVIVSRSTLDLLGDRVDAEPRAPGYHRVCSIPPAGSSHRFQLPQEPPEGEFQAQITYLVERMDRLGPYLPAELLPRIVTNPGDVRIAPDHRQVTILFANYVGVGDLIAEMGRDHPQMITQHLNDYFVHMAHIVEQYGGTVGRMDQYSQGDRLVVFFGAPRAHEDDPVRAVYTALDMQSATREHFSALQTPAGIYRFRQRIGINTGYLFAGNVGAPDLRQEYTLMGDDINMAARLMSISDWGEILISNRTQARVAAFIELEDRGELKVKGKEILIPTYQVQGRRGEIGPTRGLASGESPLVDRADELAILQDCGQRLLSGRGQVVSLVGKSGLGKSRLARELKNWLLDLGGDQLIWLEGHALSFSERMTYWLAAQMLRGALGVPAGAVPDDVLYALWQQSEGTMGKETAREAVPYLAHLLDLPLKGEWARAVQELDPGVRQKQTFWAAREFFAAMARQQPVIVALDDLHWADEASLALLEDLLAVTDRAPLMFCLVFRQQQDAGCWRLRDRAASSFPHRYTEVTLQPLAEAPSRQLLDQLLPGAVFQPEIAQKILDRATGNPFYLEEVVRSLIDGGAVVPDRDRRGHWQATDRIADISVPDTLQGAILARIDRLTEDARQALQMASVIGRRFQTQVLAALAQAGVDLDAWLAQLERSDLIRPAQLDPEPVYAFPDTLVQEVAYKSLLVQRRQEFHRQVGETLEALFADRLEEECEHLAYHFGQGNDQERAIRYLWMAGRKAQSEYANGTALQFYGELLERLSEGESTWEQRFDILDHRQQVYGLLGRQEERRADLEAMLVLAQAQADASRHVSTLNELADLYQWTGHYDNAGEIARQALEMASELGDQGAQAAALHQLGVLGYYGGAYDQARPLLEQAVSLRQSLGDPGGEAWSLMYLGMIHFFQGDYGQAALIHDRALQMARARQDWFQEGIHLTNAARVALRLGEYEKALQQFEQSLEMKGRVGDRTGQGFSLYHVGLAQTYLGRYEEAEKAFQSSLELRWQIDDERGEGYSLYGLGLVKLEQGLLDVAEDYFQQAHAVYIRLGLKAESIVALSFLGQVYLEQGRLDEAVEVSGQAIALLQEQEAVEEVQQVYLNHFRLLAARGDRTASGYLQAAYEAMLDQASRISDLDQRQTFLDRVQVNREIQAALGPGA